MKKAKGWEDWYRTEKSGEKVVKKQGKGWNKSRKGWEVVGKKVLRKKVGK